MSDSAPRSELVSARLRRALWAALVGISCLAVALVVSFAVGYDNLASGTIGGNVTTLLYVADAVLLLVAAISWTRAATPIGLRTSWRRVGRNTLIMWGATVALFVLAIVLGRVAVVVSPIVVSLASLVLVSLLPTLLWFPVWTLISAIRGQGAPSPSQTIAQEASEVPAAASSDHVPAPHTTQAVPASELESESRRQGALTGRGMFVAAGVIGVVVLGLIASVFYLLGRQSSIATEQPTAPTSAPLQEATAPTSAPLQEATAAELYGLAAAAQGCTGLTPEGLPPDAAPGFISFDSGILWEPIYVETAKRLGVPDGGISEDGGLSEFTELTLRNYVYRSAAFSAADSADPRSWYDLNQLWIKAGEYAYIRSEEVILAGEPRGNAFLDVAYRFGSLLTKACLDPVYRAVDLAKSEGLTFDAWIEKYKPDTGP